MTKPKIGLNCSLMDMDLPLKAKAVCHLKYIDAVAGAGCIPVILPPLQQDDADLERVLDTLDGFCLIGGPDYLPDEYGGHPQPANDLMAERRHRFDLQLARVLMARAGMPVLGICGGHQLMSIAAGGALVQDLCSEWQPPAGKACTLKHSDGEREGTAEAGNVYRHEVRLQPGSRIARIVGAERILANSYHHQAVRPERIGRGLTATGWAPDGVIEALEGAGERFFLGVQWHPERLADDPIHHALFTALRDAAPQA
jgi:putative glutamine amidotransferase